MRIQKKRRGKKLTCKVFFFLHRKTFNFFPLQLTFEYSHFLLLMMIIWRSFDSYCSTFLFVPGKFSNFFSNIHDMDIHFKNKTKISSSFGWLIHLQYPSLFSCLFARLLCFVLFLSSLIINDEDFRFLFSKQQSFKKKWFLVVWEMKESGWGGKNYNIFFTNQFTWGSQILSLSLTLFLKQKPELRERPKNIIEWFESFFIKFILKDSTFGPKIYFWSYVVVVGWLKMKIKKRKVPSSSSSLTNPINSNSFSKSIFFNHSFVRQRNGENCLAFSSDLNMCVINK